MLLASIISSLSAPSGACPETVAGHHSIVCPCSLSGKATLSVMAAQRPQLLWGEPGKCEVGCVLVGDEQSLLYS